MKIARLVLLAVGLFALSGCGSDGSVQGSNDRDRSGGMVKLGWPF